MADMRDEMTSRRGSGFEDMIKEERMSGGEKERPPSRLKKGVKKECKGARNECSFNSGAMQFQTVTQQGVGGQRQSVSEEEDSIAAESKAERISRRKESMMGADSMDDMVAGKERAGRKTRGHHSRSDGKSGAHRHRSHGDH